jgi:hypothetical protein
MVKREFDAEYINAVVNDPAVKDGAKIVEIADLALVASDARNFILVYDGGGFVIINRNDGVYEVHTQALKEGRGRTLRNAITEAMEFMFFQTDCVRLLTKAWKDNPASIALSNHYFNCKGDTEENYYYELLYRDWVETSNNAKEEGEKFHALVEDQKDHIANGALATAIEKHKDDRDDDTHDTHDYHVGGACLMLKYGNMFKAREMYNGWAKMSGYERIVILGTEPLVCGIGDMTLTYHNSKMEVF